jgi:hypothetical protein
MNSLFRIRSTSVRGTTILASLFAAAAASTTPGCGAAVDDGHGPSTATDQTAAVQEPLSPNGTPRQRDFVIMSYLDAPLTGTNTATDEARLRVMRDAHFNVLSSFSNGAGLSVTGHDPIGDGLANVRYYLDRVAAVPGLTTLIQDWNWWWGGYQTWAPQVSDIEYHFNTDPNGYNKLPANLRRLILGYAIADEPTYKRFVIPNGSGGWVCTDSFQGRPNTWANLVTNASSDLAVLNARDSSRILYTTITSNWKTNFVDCSTSTIDNSWEAFVRAWLGDSRTSVLSMDDYLFMKDPTGANPYTVRDLGWGPGVKWFSGMKTAAQEATAKKKNWWFTGQAIEHLQYVPPTLERLRFQAHSALIHGAKGLVWFSYAQPYGLSTDYPHPSFVDAQGNVNHAVYDIGQQVNGAIENMGPELMDLTWLATVHGQVGPDPTSNDNITDTDVVTPSTPVISLLSDYRNSDARNVAAGIFQGHGRNYLLAMNKSLTASRTIMFVLKDQSVTVSRHKKTSKAWEYLSGPSPYVWVTVQPGDVELLQLAPANPTFGSWNLSFSPYGGVNDKVAPGDYDGDGKADMAVRFADNNWKIDYAAGGFGSFNKTVALGLPSPVTDWQPVPADYDGDGKTDIAVKNAVTGQWRIRYSSTAFASWNVTRTGSAGALPAVGDYDNDGKADIAERRIDGTNDGRLQVDLAYNGFGSWDVDVKQSAVGSTGATVAAVVGDYNGDHYADFAVKDNLGTWYIDYTDPKAANMGLGSWDAQLAGYGAGTRYPAVPAADYDGDGLSDIAVRDITGAKWMIDYSTNGFGTIDATLADGGASNFQSSVGDFDGDGRADLSLKCDNGNWSIDLAKQ